MEGHVVIKSKRSIQTTYLKLICTLMFCPRISKIEVSGFQKPQEDVHVWESYASLCGLEVECVWSALFHVIQAMFVLMSSLNVNCGI